MTVNKRLPCHLFLMSHLNSTPNQTKTKTQSERQNQSERNRKKRESKNERRERGHCSQQHTMRRQCQSLAHNPQPICYHGPWPLHHRAPTIGPPYNPAKTHATKPTAHNPHATTTTTKPLAKRHHHRDSLAESDLIWWERFEFLEREVWVFLRESWWNPVNNDPWPTATVAFKVVAVETNGREKEKVRMREKEEKMKKWEERKGESDQRRENEEVRKEKGREWSWRERERWDIFIKIIIFFSIFGLRAIGLLSRSLFGLFGEGFKWLVKKR